VRKVAHSNLFSSRMTCLWASGHILHNKLRLIKMSSTGRHVIIASGSRERRPTSLLMKLWAVPFSFCGNLPLLSLLQQLRKMESSSSNRLNIAGDRKALSVPGRYTQLTFQYLRCWHFFSTVFWSSDSSSPECFCYFHIFRCSWNPLLTHHVIL